MTDASRKCREVEVYRTDDTLHTSITTNLPRLFYTTIQPIFTILFPSPPFSSFLFSSLVGSLSLSLSQRKKKKNMKQKAMKPPMMTPSRRLRAEILPMRVLRPGTWLAARVMRRLMLARVSRWAAKFSLVA